MSDLFTTDSGEDNARLIAKVITEDFGITDWKQLVQLCVDGAGQNIGSNNGCVEIVCMHFELS